MKGRAHQSIHRGSRKDRMGIFLCYIDDVICISNNLLATMFGLQDEFKHKDDKIEEPSSSILSIVNNYNLFETITNSLTFNKGCITIRQMKTQSVQKNIFILCSSTS